MGLFTRVSDTIYAFRFLRLLTTPWEKTGAYKAGLIDATGKLLRKPETSEEKSKYNIFHRLVFNVKKLLNKLPLGKTTIASYLAAFYLIKEKTGVSDKQIANAIKEATGFDPLEIELQESAWYMVEDNKMRAGRYTLLNDIAMPTTGELFALKNSTVLVKEDTSPCGNIFGVNVYSAFHTLTRQNILITQYDINQ
jgi:hypothetical protein